MAEAERVAAYLNAIDQLEPDITAIDLTAAAASIAISLKRIADSLELMSGDPNRPVNSYGEGLSEAIQNSIVRGLRGISTNG